MYVWTRECEQGVAEVKYDRKSLSNTGKRYATMVSKLPAVLMRGNWRNIDESMMPIHRLRLESLITVSHSSVICKLYNNCLIWGKEQV